MDFFEYADFASMFVTDKLWVTYLVGGLCFAVVYIFQAIALLTISKREGYANSWMAFVPFLNTYYIGVCGQKNRAFRTVSTKTIALACAILEGLLFVGYLIYNIAVAKLAAADCFYYVKDELTGFKNVYLTEVPTSLVWAAWCYKFLYDYILVWVNLVYLFLEVLVLSAFFQTYAARRYFLFTITSVFFPIQGILFFAVRNNRGMNYREYMYREQERQYNMYRQYQRSNPYQNSYNNPYQNQNPYSQNQGSPNPQTPPDDPFGDMGSGGNENNNNTDPFS